ncbi:unnamed protein product [Calypogeia fissa]
MAEAMVVAKELDEEKGVEELPLRKAEDDIGAVPLKKRSKTVICLLCCGLVGTILLLLVIIFIILIFTVFKLKSPTVQVTSTTMERVTVSLLSTASKPGSKVRLKAELDMNATVYNPNVVGFQHGSTKIQVFYHGKQIAEAAVAEGEISAMRGEKIFLPYRFDLSSNNSNGNLTHDLGTAQIIPLVSSGSFTGTIKFGAIKLKNARIKLLCNIDYFLVNSTQNFICQYNAMLI